MESRHRPSGGHVVQVIVSGAHNAPERIYKSHMHDISTRTRPQLRVCNEDNFNAAKPFLRSLCSLYKDRNKLIFAFPYVPRRALVTDHASMEWDHLQQGGTRYGCDIWSGGTNYSAVDSPEGPLFRGDCPRHDS